MFGGGGYGGGGRGGGGCGVRMLIALFVAGIALFRYFGSSQVNPVTGEKQRVRLDARQEIALGLQSAPTLARQHGGASPNQAGQTLVDQVGNRLVQNSDAANSPYRFEFHLLADRNTINAFALPGGQVFMTEALLRRLRSEAQVAGVLAHEIAHVVGRHGAEHLAKQELTQGLTGAASVAVIDPNDPRTYRNAAVVAAIGSLINMKFGRDDELESDRLGVKYMAEAGYDPRAMIRVMQVLRAAGGGGRQPEFFSTHPNPQNRLQRIEEAIRQLFPNGVPPGLEN